MADINSPVEIGVTTGPIRGSRKVHIGARTGSGIQVAMREIDLEGGEEPVRVYDTSGPYTDPAADIDIRRGLPELRRQWIDERGDTEWLDGPSSTYGRIRAEDLRLSTLRFELTRTPRRARAGANVTQLHYARQGIVTPEMEFIAIRENQRRREARTRDTDPMLDHQHPGESLSLIHI